MYVGCMLDEVAAIQSYPSHVVFIRPSQQVILTSQGSSEHSISAGKPRINLMDLDGSTLMVKVHQL